MAIKNNLLKAELEAQPPSAEPDARDESNFQSIRLPNGLQTRMEIGTTKRSLTDKKWRTHEQLENDFRNSKQSSNEKTNQSRAATRRPTVTA